MDRSGRRVEALASPLDGLLPAMLRLDALIDQAVAEAERVFGPDAATDRFRGLYVGRDEVARLLDRDPGAPLFRGEPDAAPGDAASGSYLAGLASAFGLDAFDMDLLLLALAPELDLRYERLFAYLQDDVSKRRPTVDLALNLLCASTEEKLARRAHVAPDAPLVRAGIVDLVPDSGQLRPSLLAHYLVVDEQVVRFLLGPPGLGSGVAPFAELVWPDSGRGQPGLPEHGRGLPGLVARARERREPLRLYFHGRPGAGRRHAAEQLAAEAGACLLAVDLDRALAVGAGEDFERMLQSLLREARLRDAVVYLDGLDAVRAAPSRAAFQGLLAAVDEHPGVVVLAGEQPWAPVATGPLGILAVHFPIPEFTRRRADWQASLAAAGMRLEPAEVDLLAGRFRLTSRQIADAVACGATAARLRVAARGGPPGRGGPTLADLMAAARAQAGHGLATLATKLQPVATWADIVLPPDALAQLQELCERVARRERVLTAWGFGAKLSLGRGVAALFTGPSGAGKTMGAEVVAGELGLDLYRIDLSRVVSKYVGETEKNLDRVFGAAEDANAVLFFDEADALFGKRSQVHDAHDRYANVEAAYLLQKMEEYEGLAVLATNLRENLDQAFARRLAFTIHFPFPDEAHRRRIWAGIWPPSTPLADDVDLELLAREFRLSGGSIRNAALAAAFLAADGPDGDGPVTMAHLLHAVRREHQKLGRVFPDGADDPATPTAPPGPDTSR